MAVLATEGLGLAGRDEGLGVAGRDEGFGLAGREEDLGEAVGEDGVERVPWGEGGLVGVLLRLRMLRWSWGAMIVVMVVGGW